MMMKDHTCSCNCEGVENHFMTGWDVAANRTIAFDIIAGRRLWTSQQSMQGCKHILSFKAPFNIPCYSVLIDWMLHAVITFSIITKNNRPSTALETSVTEHAFHDPALFWNRCTTLVSLQGLLKAITGQSQRIWAPVDQQVMTSMCTAANRQHGHVIAIYHLRTTCGSCSRNAAVWPRKHTCGYVGALNASLSFNKDTVAASGYYSWPPTLEAPGCRQLV